MADADKDFPYRIAYDEAVRALSQQQGMIDSLRTRAGLLLSAAAITEEPLSVAEIHRDLSLHMHGSYADNLTGQKQLASRFRLAACS